MAIAADSKYNKVVRFRSRVVLGLGLPLMKQNNWNLYVVDGDKIYLGKGDGFPNLNWYNSCEVEKFRSTTILHEHNTVFLIDLVWLKLFSITDLFNNNFWFILTEFLKHDVRFINISLWN